MQQVANVRWNVTFSEFFTMRNGVRQGAVLSAMFYCIYVNEIFTRLRNTKQGCWVNCDYVGILGYSDDNILLAPSQTALQEMLQVCEVYMSTH